MIWPFIFGVTVAFAVASGPRHRSGLLLIAFGLVFVAVAQATFPAFIFWPMSSIIWVWVSVIIGLVSKLYFPAMLVLLAGALVIPARLTGETYAIGDPFLLASDAMGCAAIIALGWPAIRNFIGGIVRVVRYTGSHRNRGVAHLSGKEAGGG